MENNFLSKILVKFWNGFVSNLHKIFNLNVYNTAVARKRLVRSLNHFSIRALFGPSRPSVYHPNLSNYAPFLLKPGPQTKNLSTGCFDFKKQLIFGWWGYEAMILIFFSLNSSNFCYVPMHLCLFWVFRISGLSGLCHGENKISWKRVVSK